MPHEPLIERRRGFTYAGLLAREEEIALELATDASFPPVLLLSEVAPVLTLGPKTTEEDLFYPREEYAKRGITLAETGRGGRATYHGPGQWVLFVMDRMERLTGDAKGVRKAVRGLLSIAEAVGREYRKEVRVVETGPELGAWSEKGKFSALGIRIARGVLRHGIAINGYRTPESFYGVKPCGLDLPLDFLLDGFSVSDREAEFERLGDRILKAAGDAIGRF